MPQRLKNRVIFIGKNSQFPRASSRPALRACKGSSHLNCKAGLSSGTQPDAVAGGTRQPRAGRTSSPPLAPVTGLEVYLPAVVGLVSGWVVVALITLVLL